MHLARGTVANVLVEPMPMARLVLLAASLAAFQLDCGVSHYSLFIAEEDLLQYYSQSDLPNIGQRVDIVRDGLVLVGNGGKLLLTDSRDFALTGSGYGSGSERVLASPSSSPFSSSSTNLPPLPPIASSVEDVRFTWIANKLVNYSLIIEQRRIYFTSVKADIGLQGTIPQVESSFILTLQCLPLSIGVGKIEVTLMTSTSSNSSTNTVQFLLEKTCDDEMNQTFVVNQSTASTFSAVTSFLPTLILTPSLSPSPPPIMPIFGSLHYSLLSTVEGITPFTTSLEEEHSTTSYLSPALTSLLISPPLLRPTIHLASMTSKTLITTPLPPQTPLTPLTPITLLTLLIPLSKTPHFSPSLPISPVPFSSIVAHESVDVQYSQTIEGSTTEPSPTASPNPVVLLPLSSSPSVSPPFSSSSSRSSSRAPSSTPPFPLPPPPPPLSPPHYSSLLTTLEAITPFTTRIGDGEFFSTNISITTVRVSPSLSASSLLSSPHPTYFRPSSIPTAGTASSPSSPLPSRNSSSVGVPSPPPSSAGVPSLPHSSSAGVSSSPPSSSAGMPSLLPSSSARVLPPPPSSSAGVPSPRSSSAVVVPSLPHSSSVGVPSSPPSSSAGMPSLLPSSSARVPSPAPSSSSAGMLSPRSSSARVFSPSLSSSAGVLSLNMEPSESVQLATAEPEEDTGVGHLHLMILVFAPVVALLLVALLVICCLVLVIRGKRRRKKRVIFRDTPLDVVYTVPYSPALGDNETFKKDLPTISLWSTLPWGLVSSLPRSTQTLIQHFVVERKSLTILDTVMRGEFGSVVKGQLNLVRTDVMSGSQSVSIKIVTGFQEGGRRDEVARFLENATLMKGLQHPNILPVLRVSVEDNSVPLVVYPMVLYGQMHGVMKLAKDPDHSVLPPLTTKLRVEFALQIAYAMKFLSENGIVHPDLALRNCLLDRELTVRVSDSALSQQFHPDCYYALYGAVRPVRWAAVETLQEGLCTSQSNVWSFGVTVWEILTYAEMPYSEVNNNRSILSHIKMGERLPRPHLCPEQLYEVLYTCWNERGEERPSFSSLVDQLKHIHSQYCEKTEPPTVRSPVQQMVGDHKSNVSTDMRLEPMATIESESTFGEQTLTRRCSAHTCNSYRQNSMGSMRSRGSRQSTDKLSVTFSILSASEGCSGNSSDEDMDTDPNLVEGLHITTRKPQMMQLLREVSATFLDGTSEPPIDLSPIESEESSPVNTTPTDHNGFTTVVMSPSSQNPNLSCKLSFTSGSETMSMTSNHISVTPEVSQSADTHSKPLTPDSVSVGTFMASPYNSSPIQKAPNHYYTSRNIQAEETKSITHTPLVVGCMAPNNQALPSLLSLPVPAAKSTDSGIRSGEDSDVPHSPVAKGNNELANGDGGSSASGIELSNLSSSFLAAFDSWDSK